MYVLLALGLTTWLPDVAFAPDQAPVALQLSADVEVHDNTAEPPTVILLLSADKETVAADGTPAPGDNL